MMSVVVMRVTTLAAIACTTGAVMTLSMRYWQKSRAEHGSRRVLLRAAMLFLVGTLELGLVEAIDIAVNAQADKPTHLLAGVRLQAFIFTAIGAAWMNSRANRNLEP